MEDVVRRVSLLLSLACGLLAAQSPELAAKSRQASKFMGAGKFAEAARVYEELVKALPNDPGLLLNLGMARQMAGQSQDAIPPLERALQLQPGIVPALLFLGAAYLGVEEPAKAVSPLRQVVAAAPRSHGPSPSWVKDAFRMLGDALASLGRFEDASEQYRNWTSLDPLNPRAWYQLGRTYESLSQAVFERLLKSAPESGYMLALLAEVQETKKQYGSAFYLYREAQRRQPGLRGIHAAIARIYRETGHPDWAAQEKEKASALPPPDCSTHKLECEFAQGRYLAVVADSETAEDTESLYWRCRAYNELARDAFNRLLKLPPSVESHQMMAQLHDAAGRHLEAVKEWRAALKLAPGDPALERSLALSLHKSRDHQAAQPILERLLQREPDSAELNFYVGDTYLAMQQPGRALPYLIKSVQRNPGYLPARSSLGRAYLQLRRGKEAIAHLEAALPLDKDGSLYFQLARAYQAAGDQTEARRMLAQYQKVRRQLEAERRKTEQELRITPPEDASDATQPKG